MCQPGEQVLSDVHLEVPISSKLSNDGKVTAATRFYFKQPLKVITNTSPPVSASTKQIENVEDAASDHSSASRHHTSIDEEMSVTMATVDEDGDLVVLRSRSQNVLIIEHAMATSLNDVGLQVWQGCLLLCDFLLNNPEMFQGQVALELGAGVGLTSIVMATMASTVFCTDVGLEVLSMCQRNIETNRPLFTDDDTQEMRHDVRVRELDWLQSAHNPNCCGPFQWDKEDRIKLDEVTIIIAADVIYDDDLTDAFFLTLRDLMTSGVEKTAFIALEKRLNFTLDDLNVTCKAYDHFHKHITELVSSPAAGVRYIVEQVQVDFTQCFQYTRTGQLELWRIRALRSGPQRSRPTSCDYTDLSCSKIKHPQVL